MKTNLFVILAFVAQTSFAAPIFCSGGGWNVDVGSQRHTATVTHEGESVQGGELACKMAYPHATLHPTSPVLECQTAPATTGVNYYAMVPIPADQSITEVRGSLGEMKPGVSHQVTRIECTLAVD